MKVRFNLKKFGVDVSKKEFTDDAGNTLSTGVLQTILSFITSKYIYSSFETVSIHSTDFNQISGSYRLYLNYLKDKDIIRINESYKKDVVTKKYMFTDSFKELAIIDGLKIENSDIKLSNPEKLNIEPWIMKKIESDFKDIQIKNIPVAKDLRFIDDEGNLIINFRKYLLNEFNLYRLRTMHYSFTYDGGRIYTPYVQLSNDVRENHIYFENQLVGLDIKNSFPLWLSVWLVQKGITMDYDTKKFFSEVQSGTFYNELILKFDKAKDLFSNTEEEKTKMTKQVVKEQFMIWLNGDNGKNNLSNYVFKCYFPEIFDFVETKKSGRRDFMYYELVSLETDFIFNFICKRLYTEIPEIKILTCHDQIYFEERFTKEVKLIWDEEIKKIHSLIPANYETEDRDDDLSEIGIYEI